MRIDYDNEVIRSINSNINCLPGLCHCNITIILGDLIITCTCCAMQSHALLLSIIVISVLAVLTQAQKDDKYPVQEGNNYTFVKGDKYYFEKCGARINNGRWQYINFTEWPTVKENITRGDVEELTGPPPPRPYSTSVPLGLSGELEDIIQYLHSRAFHIQIPVWVCEHLCAGKSGWILYPTNDILTRFWMWKLPLVMLLANVHFAPLGWLNSLCVAAHVLGDPINFIASLNTRLKVGSRHYKHWQQSAVNSESPNHHCGLQGKSVQFPQPYTSPI